MLTELRQLIRSEHLRQLLRRHALQLVDRIPGSWKYLRPNADRRRWWCSITGRCLYGRRTTTGYVRGWRSRIRWRGCRILRPELSQLVRGEHLRELVWRHPLQVINGIAGTGEQIRRRHLRRTTTNRRGRRRGRRCGSRLCWRRFAVLPPCDEVVLLWSFGEYVRGCLVARNLIRINVGLRDVDERRIEEVVLRVPVGERRRVCVRRFGRPVRRAPRIAARVRVERVVLRCHRSNRPSPAAAWIRRLACRKCRRLCADTSHARRNWYRRHSTTRIRQLRSFRYRLLVHESRLSLCL